MTTDDPNDARSILTAAFAERPTPVLDVATREDRKQRAISGIQAVLAQPRPLRIASTRRFPFRETAAVVALAAGLALAVGRLWPNEPDQAPVAFFRATAANGQILCDRDDGKNWTTCDPATVAGVVGLRTLDGAGVTVETAAGVRLDLEASSTLLMTDSKASAMASRVTLTEGVVDVRVPKLGPHRQFSVLTPSAAITVHGTAFSVEVKKTASHSSHTCVRLREGIISVKAEGREERLVAPAAWGCGDSAEAIAAASDVVVGPSASATNNGAPGNPSIARRTSPADRSTLAQQTKLLQRALGAEQRKDLVAAERGLKQLLHQYPDSIVAPEARAALERIAAQKNDKRHE